VLAVIVFHTFPKVLPGGFVGVDIFFVISGYLITQIILEGMDSGGFTASSFYARRARRIFPALIVVLIATFALGWNYFLPLELTSLAKNIVASAAFFGCRVDGSTSRPWGAVRRRLPIRCGPSPCPFRKACAAGAAEGSSTAQARP
jgi:hypothetical protein